MSSNVDEWISSVAEQIEVAASESIHEVAQEAAQLVRDYTYPGRKVTRNSVRVVITGPYTATVGLYFGRKYTKNTNSFTYRHFRKTWDHIRPMIAPRLAKRMNGKLQKTFDF